MEEKLETQMNLNAFGIFATVNEVTICELNLENLFISLDYYQGEKLESLSEEEWRKLAVAQLQRKQKPLKKVWGLALAIQDINPDILMLVEVGGRESLEHFNRHFLNEAYKTYFIESNSKRSIDLAFLVKKDLPFELNTNTHRDTSLEVKTYLGTHLAKFSRDVAELHLTKEGTPRLILLLTHFKSKISTDEDYQGRDLRAAEAAALAAIYEKVKRKYSDVPVVVGGDFNTDLSDATLELLQKTDLTDFHDVLGTPKEERVTLVHFDHRGRPHPQVLDYLLVSPHLLNRVVVKKSCTYRYKSFYNIPHPLPETIEGRRQMPSDHYPLVLTLEI